MNFYFVVDKGTFGVDEVTDNPLWPSAFWLILEGVTPADVSSAPNLGGTFSASNIPGLQVIPDAPTYELGDTGASANKAQRIRFPFDVKFTTSSLSAFPAAGAETFFSLSATIIADGNPFPLAPTAEIELVGGADPYFTNVNPDQGNFFYLSQDLRVFTITAGTTIGSGGGAATLGPGGVPDAYSFIKQLITYVNGQFGYSNTTSFIPPTDPASPDPLDGLLGSSQTGGLTGDSSVTQGTMSEPNYNFAIARVRLNAPGGTTTSSGVSVFFRLFSTQTNDTDFIDTTAAAVAFNSPNVTYPTSAMGAPTVGTDMSGNVNGCTLPFFATANYSENPTDYAVGGPNNQTIVVPTGRDYVWAFFGCFLNVYDPSNIIGGKTIQEWLAGGTHHCLVAQIAYADAPITNSGGVVASPENNDELAQRNLQITPSGNPWFPRDPPEDPQTFDLRPSPAQGLATGRLAGYPDELMIDWGEPRREPSPHLLARGPLVGRAHARRAAVPEPPALGGGRAHHRVQGWGRRGLRPHPRGRQSSWRASSLSNCRRESRWGTSSRSSCAASRLGGLWIAGGGSANPIRRSRRAGPACRGLEVRRRDLRDADPRPAGERDPPRGGGPARYPQMAAQHRLVGRSLASRPPPLHRLCLGPRQRDGRNAATIPRRSKRLLSRAGLKGWPRRARAARTAAPARSRVLSTIVSATSKGSSSKRKRGRRAPSRAPDRRSRRWSGARGWNGSC